MHVGRQQNPESTCSSPQASGCPTPLLLGGGPHRPWKWAQGPLVKNSGVMGDGMAPVAQIPCSEARVEQEEGTGVSRT